MLTIVVVVIHGYHTFLIRIDAEACVRILVVAIRHDELVLMLMMLLFHLRRRLY